MRSLICIAVLVLISTANLVVDGSFENAGYTSCNGGQKSCTGLTRIFPWIENPGLQNSWKAEPKIAEIHSSFHSFSNGNFAMDLNEKAPYTLYQQLNGFDVGQAYILSFDVSRNDECGTDDTKTGYARINGSGLDSGLLQFSVPGGQSGWTTKFIVFVPTNFSHTIYIGSTTVSSNCGPLLDNVIVGDIYGMTNSINAATNANRRRELAAMKILHGRRRNSLKYKLNISLEK